MKMMLAALTLLAAMLAPRTAGAAPAAQLSQFKLGPYITGPQTTLARPRARRC